MCLRRRARPSACCLLEVISLYPTFSKRTRAVGRALSKNPVPIVLPCHRVIESDGSTGGYSSGVNRKIRLLELEYYSLMDT